MHSIPSILYVFLVCGTSQCHYRNAIFHFTADIPNAPDVTVCRPLENEGAEGYRYIFGRKADCEQEDIPSIGVYVDVNAFRLSSVKDVAKQLCDKGSISESNMKVDGFPVVECLDVDRDKDGWVDDEYLAVGDSRNGDDGLVMTVVLSGPKKDAAKYRPALLRIMKGIRIGNDWRR